MNKKQRERRIFSVTTKNRDKEIFPKRNLSEAKWLTTGQQQID